MNLTFDTPSCTKQLVYSPCRGKSIIILELLPLQGASYPLQFTTGRYHVIADNHLKTYGKRLRRLVIIVSSYTKGANSSNLR